MAEKRTHWTLTGSEIQASFALKEMSKGALFALIEQLRAELEGLRERHPDLVAKTSQGIDWLTESLSALFGPIGAT